MPPKRKAESEEVIRRKRAKQKEKRQAAKQDAHCRGLTDEEKRIALTLLEVRPSKVDKRSGGPCPDFAGTASVLRNPPYNWPIPYEGLLGNLLLMVLGNTHLRIWYP